MERVLASVLELADVFCKHLCAPAAFLGWALPLPHNQESVHASTSPPAVRLLHQKAVLWWLGVLRTAEKSDDYLENDKSSFYPQELQLESHPLFLWWKPFRHEEWNWNIPTTQIQGFTQWSQTKSRPHFRLYGPQVFSRNKSCLSCLFPKATRTQRLPRDRRLLPKQRKETFSFLVHPLWKHKSAIRSYRIFFLFIINIVPEAVTCRRKKYERISTHFDN